MCVVALETLGLNGIVKEEYILVNKHIAPEPEVREQEIEAVGEDSSDQAAVLYGGNTDTIFLIRRFFVMGVQGTPGGIRGNGTR